MDYNETAHNWADIDAIPQDWKRFCDAYVRDERLAGPVLRSNGRPNIHERDTMINEVDDSRPNPAIRDEEEFDAQEELLEDSPDRARKGGQVGIETDTMVYTTSIENESPRSIARKYGCSAADIVRMNQDMPGGKMYQSSKLRKGTGLNIPVPIVSDIKQLRVLKSVVRRSEYLRAINSGIYATPTTSRTTSLSTIGCHWHPRTSMQIYGT